MYRDYQDITTNRNVRAGSYSYRVRRNRRERIKRNLYGVLVGILITGAALLAGTFDYEAATGQNVTHFAEANVTD